MILAGEDWRSLRETCHHATLSIRFHWAVLGSNAGCRGEKQATNRLRYGTAVTNQLHGGDSILVMFHRCGQLIAEEHSHTELEGMTLAVSRTFWRNPGIMDSSVGKPLPPLHNDGFLRSWTDRQTKLCSYTLLIHAALRQPRGTRTYFVMFLVAPVSRDVPPNNGRWHPSRTV
jgi:hypothetical protein